MAMQEIMQAIDRYKDLAIECVLQKDETIVKEMAEAKADMLEIVMSLIRISQKQAVIDELKQRIES